MTEHEAPLPDRSREDEAHEDRRAIATELMELRREHAETAAVIRDFLTSQADWFRLRTSILSSLLQRPIQWAIAVVIVAALGALIARGQALDALSVARQLSAGGTSIVVTGAAPPSPPPPDESSTP